MPTKKKTTPRRTSTRRTAPTLKKVQNAPAPPAPVKPISYTVKAESVGELVAAINELIPGKFAKKVLFDIINGTFAPNFPPATKGKGK